MKICQVQQATGYLNTEFGGNVWTGETDLVLPAFYIFEAMRMAEITKKVSL